MKHIHGKNIILGTAGLVMLMAQPAWAVTKITDVQLKPADNGGIQVILKTASGSRPQIFTTKRGKSLVTDIINTQLKLGKGNNFSQKNPAPGIAFVTINQLDANSIRLVVSGNDNALNSQPVKRGNNKFTLSFTPGSPSQPGETSSNQPSTAVANKTPTPKPPMVPNPKVTIDGKTAPTDGIAKPPVPAPPFLPRAVAPPVGDMAIANLDASPSSIDLGTQERVPRLVLRDAPVREVLSLLARAAGLNLAYIGGANSNGEKTDQATTANSSATISLDIENEPVQDVFNYVLRLSGLEANRNGRTIFVGAKLPNAARDIVMRNVRLNQVKVDVALNFLVGMGAESAINVERVIKNVESKKVEDDLKTEEQDETTIKQIQPLTLQTESKYTTPILRGLQALGDTRTNSVTLVGSPKLVSLAMAQLTHLDVRRRQVAVNIKIIDVNLSNAKDFGTSFSFGIGDTYFENDGGRAIVNFGRRADSTVDFPKRLIASLEAQVTSNNAKILTDPTLIVQEGQEATVKLTEEVVGNISNTITRGSDTSNEVTLPEKQEVGLIVGVKVEQIDDNGFVSLSVAPSLRAPAGEADTSEGPIILISERSLNSGLVRLRDGQTLILSGIIQDQDRVTASKIPILGDIPLLGSLFRSTSRTNTRNEVIVLLTPQIMDDSQRSSYGYNYKPSPDARQMLKRGGLKIPK